MTPLLEQAIAAVAKLSPEQQDDFARWMLAELANQQRWRESAQQAADSLEWFAEDSFEEIPNRHPPDRPPAGARRQPSFQPT